MLPISFLAFFVIVLVLPFVDPAQHLGIGMSFLLSVLGAPIYLVCIFWKSKPRFLSKLNIQVIQKRFYSFPRVYQKLHVIILQAEHLCQKLFLALPEGEVIIDSESN